MILVHDVKHQISFNYLINILFEVIQMKSHVKIKIIVCAYRKREKKQSLAYDSNCPLIISKVRYV